MLTIRKANDRGHANHGWLQSHHSFSFASYHDPDHMGFGNLRVLNEDYLAGGAGFGMHSHRDMEIISYVVEGALAHTDSIGFGSKASASEGLDSGVILPGDVQLLSAGKGVHHSEFNNLQDSITHFLQIWIFPDRLGNEPGYEQVHVSTEQRRGNLALIASPTSVNGAVTVHADARIRAGFFDGSERHELALKPDRLSYVHLVRGSLRVNAWPLEAGDALMLSETDVLTLDDGVHAEVLVFDLKP